MPPKVKPKEDDTAGMTRTAFRMASRNMVKMLQVMAALTFLAVLSLVVRNEWLKEVRDREHRQEVRDREMHYLLRLSESNKATDKVADRIDRLREEQKEQFGQMIRLLEKLADRKDVGEAP